ncbi:suppressor of swi4 1-like protein [Plakobranchus ocellatus]|uniref:Suppressor of swi4 1-like protein n=1 Tax=Plakobranchus ocellatus TaxID=259542 RepID=A0AAV3ZR71_9GAST|nr:suppressor of swi4 1-like protein [Plakobranchus ocellatus]
MGRHKGRKGKSAKNAQANQPLDGKEDLYLKAPHSFVFHRGHVGKTVKELVLDVRKLMEPYTASSLKVKKKNVMKDFLSVAGPLHVTHFIVFTKTDVATYMKLICVPRGPTLTFKVNEFALARDVLSFQKHPDVESRLFTNHAVMVTNIPSDNMEHRLMNVTFKNMFPSINPNTVRLDTMRRTVLINYDPETQNVDLRHYSVKVVPTGVSRAMKKLMKTHLPDLGHHKDIADIFLDKGLSDSEGEQDGPHNQVTVSQKIRGRGITHNAVNAIRLKEIGPRLNLKLVKIEEGFEGGNVMFHALVQKTPEELEALKQLRQNKQKEKLARKQRQEANVKRKQQEKAMQKQKSLEGMTLNKKKENQEQENESSGDDEEDDDLDYYREEVGEEPEPELFSQSKKRKRTSSSQGEPKRKQARPNGKKGSDSIQIQKTKGKNKRESKFSFKMTSKSPQNKKIGKKNGIKGFLILVIASPQGDLRLSGPPSGQGPSGRARTCRSLQGWTH